MQSNPKSQWRIHWFKFTVVLAVGIVLIGYVTQLWWQTLSFAIVFTLIWGFFSGKVFFDWLTRAQLTNHPINHNQSVWEMLQNIYQTQSTNYARLNALHDELERRVIATTAVLDDGVVLLDQENRFSWWNSAAEKWLGLKVSDKGQPISHLIRNPSFLKLYQQDKVGESLELPSPAMVNVQLQIQSLPFGNNERLLMIRDVTQLRQLEMMRRDFIANVSHELRTPLTVLRGYLETILEYGAETKTSKWNSALLQMQEQSVRMQNLLQDLLLLSQLESTPMVSHLEPIDLAKMVQSIQLDMEVVSKGKHDIDLTLKGEAFEIEGSETEIHSAIVNLTMNAIKYTPEKGSIRLLVQEENEQVIFMVEDTGIGISEHQLPRLTERFYRVDPGRSNKSGGTGLGLAIVKHVLHRHQGTLEVESVLGKGSCFICHFPKSRSVAY